MKVITKYVFRELIPNYFVGLAFFSVILVINQVFVSVKYIWEHNNRGTTVYRLDFYENKEKILYSFENVICNRGAPLYLRKLSTEELLEL